MARIGIDKDAVYKAADELREEGIAPTVQTVRDRIGSGSYSTVSKHLAAWKDENAEAAVADIPEIPEKVQGAFAQIWATASRSALEGLEAQREALGAAQREMDRERAAMAAEIERLEDALDGQTDMQRTTEEQRDAERTGREAAESRVTELQIEIARLAEQVKGLEAGAQAQVQTLAAVSHDRDRLERQLGEETTRRERMETALEQERKDKATEVAKVAGLEADKARLSEQVAGLETHVREETARREQIEAERDRDREAQTAQSTRIAELTTDNARLDERATAAERRAGELKTQFEGLQQQFAAAIKQAKPPATRKKAPAPKPAKPEVK